ncbi:transcriptional regulator SlyA [Photobacterium sagamiensis]|uniref:transcriptional regulator SlyA n=1 Tax=Photobacterium sagamiensis TaxID=2910241 RepID=UPI003D0C7157
MVDDMKMLRTLSLAEQLGRVARLWRTVADRELFPLELTNSRWTALWKLQRLNDNVSQKALANALEIELASLMRTLNQLEEQGLIVRRCCEKDKRVRIVSLTDKGRSVITQIEDHILHIRQDLLADIDDEELIVVKSVLERIAHNAFSKLNETEAEKKED